MPEKPPCPQNGACFLRRSIAAIPGAMLEACWTTNQSTGSARCSGIRVRRFRRRGCSRRCCSLPSQPIGRCHRGAREAVQADLPPFLRLPRLLCPAHAGRDGQWCGVSPSAPSTSRPRGQGRTARRTTARPEGSLKAVVSRPLGCGNDIQAALLMRCPNTTGALAAARPHAPRKSVGAHKNTTGALAAARPHDSQEPETSLLARHSPP
jgi:hypothetical protein